MFRSGRGKAGLDSLKEALSGQKADTALSYNYLLFGGAYKSQSWTRIPGEQNWQPCNG